MEKLLATGKTDLLEFVSARTRRGFSAFLVRQPDGKIGFEFEVKEGGKGRGTRGGSSATALRALGAHPKDGKPVELHAGRYGPYVKHGTTNATIPDRDQVNTLTLEEAVALLEAKEARGSDGIAKAPRKTAARPRVAKEPAPKAATKTAVPPAEATAKRTAPRSAKVAGRTAVKPTAAAKRTTKPAAKAATRTPAAVAARKAPAARAPAAKTAKRARRTGA
jgi:hypothetical protein